MVVESVSTASCCLLIRSSASDSRRESTTTPLLPTKVVLPKKKPEKWSTGVAPGKYGGPPLTTKLRKYWGGKDNEDPVTDMDDFIGIRTSSPRCTASSVKTKNATIRRKKQILVF